MSRRGALNLAALLAVSVALFVSGCSAGSSGLPPDAPVIARSPLPRDTPPRIPPGIHKIKHVIIVMQENRSFDSYFGTFPGADGIPMKDGSPSPCLPKPDGSCVAPFHDPRLQNAGGPHATSDALDDIDGGRMDGFARRALEGEAGCLVFNDQPFPRCSEVPRRPDAMGYHDDREIPNYWAYARHFALQDHMFSSTLGPSLPAHLYLVSGWSAVCSDMTDPMTCTTNSGLAGAIHPYTSGVDFRYAWTDLTYLLHKHHVGWAYYIAPKSMPDCDEHIPLCERPSFERGTPGIWNPLPEFMTVIKDRQLRNIKRHPQFFAAARRGELPAVSWIVPNKRNSEHPPASVADGQAWVTRVVNAVMRSPEWKSSAIFVSWDDWGGFYDHVVPPRVDGAGYGIRVPSLIISPYAKRNFIDHQVLSFDAYLKFIEDDFLGGARIDPRTDGRPDSRPNVREDAPVLGNLIRDFDFSHRGPKLILGSRPSP